MCSNDDAEEQKALTTLIRPVFDSSKVHLCRRCKVHFILPLPSDSDLKGIYEEEYFQSYGKQQIAFPAETELPATRYRARLANVQRQRGPGRLLEIGPGHGTFLNFARQSGWDVIGIDTSRYVAEQVHARYGIEVRCATLDSSGFPDETFDAVHMSHVLEHLRNPIATLQKVRRLLKPGGTVIVEVPNEFRNLQFRIMKRIRLARPYKVKSTHLVFFSPSTLRQALVRAGFFVERLDTIRDMTGGSPLRQLARRVASFLEQPLKMGPLIEAVAVKEL